MALPSYETLRPWRFGSRPPRLDFDPCLGRTESDRRTAIAIAIAAVVLIFVFLPLIGIVLEIAILIVLLCSGIVGKVFLDGTRFAL